MSAAGSRSYSEPPQSPLFHAENSGRYERQAIIQAYQQIEECRLVVLIDAIFGYSVTLFEELIYDADPSVDLHLLLSSPGGDGEAAVRLVRSAQSRCRRLTVIVPDQAKSAGTLLAIGAHQIVMAPTSDLGPVDPQFQIGRQLVSAKDIIAAFVEATESVNKYPDTYPIHASLLSDVTAIMVQQARSALGRTQDLLQEALRSHPGRTMDEVRQLSESLAEPLIDRPQSHAALFSDDDALKAGLPVKKAVLDSDSWRMLWRLWAKYFMLGPSKIIYENDRASQILDRPDTLEITRDAD